MASFVFPDRAAAACPTRPGNQGGHQCIGQSNFPARVGSTFRAPFAVFFAIDLRVTRTYHSIQTPQFEIQTSSFISGSTSGDERKAALKSNGLTPYLRDKARQSHRRGVSTPLSPSRALCGSFLSPALSRSSLSSSNSRLSPPLVFQPLLDYFYPIHSCRAPRFS